MLEPKFEAQPLGRTPEQWWAVGYDAEGEEIWTDNGCVFDDKRTAERVAANMETAYRQGVLDTKKQLKKALS